MRHKGRIQDWNDDRGFGFIASATGGAPTFVHATSFANRSRRPNGGDLVTYELSADREGRPRAIEVQFVGEHRTVAGRASPIPLPMTVGAGFMVLLAALVALGVFPIVLLALYTIASTIALLAYKVDKSAAKASSWRIPENTLLAIGLLGGWPGSLVAMALLRHKSRKSSFRSAFWLSVVANLATLVWLATPSGSATLARLAGAP